MATTAGSFGTNSAAAGAGNQSGQFPVNDQTYTVATPAVLATLNKNVSQAQFMAMTGVTSTELATYQTNGQLNQAAYELVQYFSMSPEERQSVQQDLVNAGFLSASDVTGMASSGLTAVKQAINVAGTQGVPLQQYLAVAGSPIAGAQQTALQETQAATKSLENPAAIVESETNPTTISADQEAAWNTILGYAPSAQQIAQFTAGIHAQDYAAAAAGNTATKQTDEQILANAKQANTQLDAMGADGVTLFASLYQKALGGPAVGPGAVAPTTPGTTAPATTAPPATDVGPHTPPGTVPSGAAAATPGAPASPAMGANLANPNALEPSRPVQGVASALGGAAQAAGKIGIGAENAVGTPGAGVLGAAANAVGGIPNAIGNIWDKLWDPSGNGTPAMQNEARRVLAGHARTPGASTSGPANLAGAMPAGATASTTMGTGMYMLSPAMWKAALAVYGQKNATPTQYPNEASAPIAVQQAAFTALASSMFGELGSWSAVTNALQSGSPSGIPTGTAARIASSINTQINNDVANIQNELNNQPVVTVKETAPDVTNEAAQAAKASDPIGYTAANMSSAGAVLQSMIYGSPVNELQPDASTFTGPVALNGAPITSPPAATAGATSTTTGS